MVMAGCADLQAGAEAAQQPPVEGVGFATPLGPDGLQLPATDHVVGVDPTSPLANLPLARQQIVPRHRCTWDRQEIQATVADMLSDCAQAC